MKKHLKETQNKKLLAGSKSNQAYKLIARYREYTFELRLTCLRCKRKKVKCKTHLNHVRLDNTSNNSKQVRADQKYGN